MHEREAASPARFVVGFDLGTTNCAAAWVDTLDPERRVRVFSIPQIIAPGEVAARETLPSFHYETAPGEFNAGALRLPWSSEDPNHAVGIWAREHGANAPKRLIFSAKSWLCHAGVDRTADLLPWHGAADATKLSPVEATARYLAHWRAAWDFAHPDALLEKQEVVITIPASFDEIARELTVNAARRAGLPRVVLLEEPQAAFYAWIEAQGSSWSDQVQAGQKILVCDVGGGTTDFTLIQVQPDAGEKVRFHRTAVGEHLILGGDNLDLALAHFVEQKLVTPLTPRQWSILVRRCQQAKETLCAADPPERVSFTIPGSGAKLIGDAVPVELTRAEVHELLVDGFLPRVRLDEKPLRRGSGLQEFGLPYAPDHAITRYLAAFLTAHVEQTGHARPDVVLFNGGLFASPVLRARLIEVLRSWFPENNWSPIVLQNERLDLAVALGAAYYGLVRRGEGVKISGGLARSYYLGVENQGQEAALCLAPAGLEEGVDIDLANRTFDLVVRQPAEFPLYVSSARTTDRSGDLVPVDPLQLSALPPLRTVLRTRQKADSISVQLHARLTEIGTLELWCTEIGGRGNWRLQFDVRAALRTDARTHEAVAEQAGFVEEEIVQASRALLRQAFAPGAEKAQLESLVKTLEKQTGLARLDWPPSLLRSFWEELLALEPARHRSPLHEARWLNLLGFALRPGFGFAVDDWRVAQTWRLFEKKVAHEKSESCRAEWWILWRRIGGGLTAGQQTALAEPLVAFLRREPKKAERAAQLHRHEWTEIWRLFGSLELFAVAVKEELGEALLRRFQEPGRAVHTWALGRLGSRTPFYGGLNHVVPGEVAARWALALIAKPEGRNKELFFAVTQLARRTGDRYRDIPSAAREEIIAWLTNALAPQHDLQLVAEGGALDEAERDSVFGEALPKGLRLTTD